MSLLWRAPAYLATRSHLCGDRDSAGHDSLPLAGLPGRGSLQVDVINSVRRGMFPAIAQLAQASDSDSINRSAATLRTAVATLGVRMQCLFVVDGDFFAGVNIAQREEQYVAVQILHVGVRLARMIDVMRAVAAPGAVQTATAVDVADAQDSAVATELRSFEIRDAFARVLRDLFSARKKLGGKATSAINARRFDREPWCELNFHHSHFTTDRLPERCLSCSPPCEMPRTNQGRFCSGSATLMSGKSSTCRRPR